MDLEFILGMKSPFMSEMFLDCVYRDLDPGKLIFHITYEVIHT